MSSSWNNILSRNNEATFYVGLKIPLKDGTIKAAYISYRKTGFNIDIYCEYEEETNTIKKIIENRSYPKIILNTFAAQTQLFKENIMNPILNMIFSIIIMLLLIMASRKLLDNEHELLFFLIFNIAGFIFEYIICGLRGSYLVFQLILWLFFSLARIYMNRNEKRF